MQFFLLFFASFLAGILTFHAPCTLPIIPVYLTICLKQNFRSLTRHTLYLALGIALVYVTLGVFAGSIGGFVLIHKRTFITIVGTLLILVGIATFFGLSLSRVIPKQKNFTPLGTVVYGILFGLAWSGCIGPVLGGVLVLAGSTGTAVQGAIMLLAYAAGLVFPLIILSIVADRSKKIPKFWRFLYGKTVEWRLGNRSIILHTTNIITGLIFIAIGLFFLLNGAVVISNSFPRVANILFNWEDNLQAWISV